MNNNLPFRSPLPTKRQTASGPLLRRRKPALALDQAAQIFDLTGVAGVAIDDAGEPDS
jgi:hypothetical protein